MPVTHFTGCARFSGRFPPHLDCFARADARRWPSRRRRAARGYSGRRRPALKPAGQSWRRCFSLAPSRTDAGSMSVHGAECRSGGTACLRRPSGHSGKYMPGVSSCLSQPDAPVARAHSIHPVIHSGCDVGRQRQAEHRERCAANAERKLRCARDGQVCRIGTPENFVDVFCRTVVSFVATGPLAT